MGCLVGDGEGEGDILVFQLPLILLVGVDRLLGRGDVCLEGGILFRWAGDPKISI